MNPMVGHLNVCLEPTGEVSFCSHSNSFNIVSNGKPLGNPSEEPPVLVMEDPMAFEIHLASLFHSKTWEDGTDS